MEEEVKTGHYSNASCYVRDLTAASMRSGAASRNSMAWMNKFSGAAASDIEEIREKSFIEWAAGVMVCC